MELNEFGQEVGITINDWFPRQKPIPTILYGRFCDLVPMDADVHGPLLFDSLSTHGQDGLFTYMHFGPFYTCEQFVHWLKNGDVNEICYAAIDRRNDQVSGFISLHGIDVEHGVIEIGIFLSKSLHSTAAATELIYFLLCEVFDHLHYRRCQWRCNSLNKQSKNLATRIGFIFEGTFRNFYVLRGRNSDVSWFSILDTEWPEIRLRLEQWLSPDNFDANGKQITRLQKKQDA